MILCDIDIISNDIHSMIHDDTISHPSFVIKECFDKFDLCPNDDLWLAPLPE